MSEYNLLLAPDHLLKLGLSSDELFTLRESLKYLFDASLVFLLSISREDRKSFFKSRVSISSNPAYFRDKL